MSREQAYREAGCERPANFTEQEAKLYVRLLFVAADSLDRGTPHDLRVARAATEAYERIGPTCATAPAPTASMSFRGDSVMTKVIRTPTKQLAESRQKKSRAWTITQSSGLPEQCEPTS